MTLLNLPPPSPLNTINACFTPIRLGLRRMLFHFRGRELPLRGVLSVLAGFIVCLRYCTSKKSCQFLYRDLWHENGRKLIKEDPIPCFFFSIGSVLGLNIHIRIKNTSGICSQLFFLSILNAFLLKISYIFIHR